MQHNSFLSFCFIPLSWRIPTVENTWYFTKYPSLSHKYILFLYDIFLSKQSELRAYFWKTESWKGLWEEELHSTLPWDPHPVDSYCQKGENMDTWCDSSPLIPGYSLVVQGALLDTANVQWSSAASTRGHICETAAAPMDARGNENIHPEHSSAWATSVHRLGSLDSTLWDFFTHSPSDMAEGTSSLQLRGALLRISWEKESYAILS